MLRKTSEGSMVFVKTLNNTLLKGHRETNHMTMFLFLF